MAGDKPVGKVIPFGTAAGKGDGKQLNPFLHKMAERVLKPVVIGAAVIVVSLATLTYSASAKTPAKKAGGGDITLQSDTLAIKPSVKSTPLPPATNAAIQEVLSEISQAYPDVLKAWAAGRQLDIGAEFKPLELNLQLVNRAKFDSLEYTGRSVIFDPDAQAIFINGNAPLDKRELAVVLCSIFGSYGGFGEVMPFHELGLVPSLMAYSILPPSSAKFKPPPDGGQQPVLTDREAVALWFAQIAGIKEFVNAYGRGDVIFVRKTYEQKAGAESYNELMNIVYQWKGPGSPLPNSTTILNAISRRIRQSARDQILPLAEALGFKAQPVPKVRSVP